MGKPLAPNKLEGPTTRLTFLGIFIDSSCMETSLPNDKLQELLSEPQSWYSRNKCLKRELLSLTGKLNFACRIIPAGRIFLRRLIDLSTSARLPHHHVTMNRESRLDITWWLQFLPTWNGRDIIPEPHWIKSPCQTPSRKRHFIISSCRESSAQWASLHVSAFPLPCPSFGRLRRS